LKRTTATRGRKKRRGKSYEDKKGRTVEEWITCMIGALFVFILQSDRLEKEKKRQKRLKMNERRGTEKLKDKRFACAPCWPHHFVFLSG
jgi:hypothetical protein